MVTLGDVGLKSKEHSIVSRQQWTGHIQGMIDERWTNGRKLERTVIEGKSEAKHS